MSEKQKQALANICAIANQIPEEEQEKLASYAEGYAAGYNAGNGAGNEPDGLNLTTEEDA